MPRRLPRALLGITLGLAVACLLGTAAMWLLARQVGHLPALTAAEQGAAIADLQRQLSQLAPPESPRAGAESEPTEPSAGATDGERPAPASDVPQRQCWEITLTQTQMQAWLQQNLPSESIAVPGTVTNPRVVLQDGGGTVVCDFHSDSIESTVSLDLEPFVDQRPNRLGLRVLRARAGWFPVPLKKVLWRMLWLARESGLQIHYQQNSEDAIAWVGLPGSSAARQMRVESCQVTSDGLLLKGVTESLR